MKIENLVKKILLEIEEDSKRMSNKYAKKTTSKSKKIIKEGPTPPPPEAIGNDEEEVRKSFTSKERTESKKQEFKEQGTPPPAEGTPPPVEGGDDESAYDVDGEPPATDNVDNEQYEVDEEEESYAICEKGDSTICDVYFKKGATYYFTIEEIKQNNIPIEPETYVYVYSTDKYTQAGKIKAFVDSGLVMPLGPNVRDPNAWINDFPECVRKYNKNLNDKNFYTNDGAIEDGNKDDYKVVFFSSKRNNGFLAVAYRDDISVPLTYFCEGGLVNMTDMAGNLYTEKGQVREQQTTTFKTEANAIFKINEYLGIKFLCETEANCIGIFIDKDRYELNENALEALNEHFIKQINGAYRGDSIGQYCELVRHLVEVYKILSEKHPSYTPYSDALQVAEDTKKQLDEAITKAQQFITTVPGMKGNLSSWNIKTSPTSKAEMSLYTLHKTSTTPYIKNVFTVYKPISVGVGRTDDLIKKGSERIEAGKMTKEQCKQQLYSLARLSGLGDLKKYMSADVNFQKDASFFEKIFKTDFAVDAPGTEGIELLKQKVKVCYDAGMYKGKWYDLYNRFFGPGRTNKINPNAQNAEDQVSTSTTTIYQY